MQHLKDMAEHFRQLASECRDGFATLSYSQLADEIEYGPGEDGRAASPGQAPALADATASGLPFACGCTGSRPIRAPRRATLFAYQ
jgi:hypothetical protein